MRSPIIAPHAPNPLAHVTEVLRLAPHTVPDDHGGAHRLPLEAATVEVRVMHEVLASRTARPTDGIAGEAPALATMLQSMTVAHTLSAERATAEAQFHTAAAEQRVVRALRACADYVTRLGQLDALEPAEAWHEDLGPVLWWHTEGGEPYVGTPLDTEFPAGYPHFSRIHVPSALTNGSVR